MMKVIGSGIWIVNINFSKTNVENIPTYMLPAQYWPYSRQWVSTAQYWSYHYDDFNYGQWISASKYTPNAPLLTFVAVIGTKQAFKERLHEMMGHTKAQMLVAYRYPDVLPRFPQDIYHWECAQ